MWDTVRDSTHRVSHDIPCPACGHGAHTYLPCSGSCACTPPGVPGGGLGHQVLVGQL